MKKIPLTVESFIDELDALDNVESSDSCKSVCDATLTETPEALVVEYSETENGETAHSKIEIAEGAVTVTRTGSIESRFVFIEGESTKSLYKVPPYSFDAEIFTKKIRNNFTRGGGKINILYTMTVGGAKKAVRMQITSPGTDEV